MTFSPTTDREGSERVSVDSAGGQGNSYSDIPSISADGRYVAFESSASNLIFGDTNGWCDVFVHDRQTGITDRVSVDSTGGEGDSHSWYPSISGDGRHVAFYSLATNLVFGDTNTYADVFVRDRKTGVTTRESVDSGGGEGNHDSGLPSISEDGWCGRSSPFPTTWSPVIPTTPQTSSSASAACSATGSNPAKRVLARTRVPQRW